MPSRLGASENITLNDRGGDGGGEGERVKNPTEMVAKGRYFHLYITIQIACVMM